MKDQVNKMRWVVFLLLVVSLVFAGAALAMAEEGVFGAAEGTDTTVSTEPVAAVGDETLPEIAPAEDPLAADTTSDPAADPNAEAPVVDEPSVGADDSSADVEPEATPPQALFGENFEIVFGFDADGHATMVVNYADENGESATLPVPLARTNNHGAYVSALAKAKPRGMKTSAWVRLLAQSDVGKKGFDQTAVDEEATEEAPGDEQVTDDAGTDADEPAVTDDRTTPTDEVTPPPDEGQTTAPTVAPQTGTSSSKSLHAAKSFRSTKSIHATKSVKAHSNNMAARGHGKGHRK